MKRTLLFIAFALTGLSANIANAQTTIASGDCGASGNNLTWVLTSDSVLTISGSGAMADYDWGNAPWFSNRTAIKTLVIGNSVTTIGNLAFDGYSRLSGVLTIPNSVTYIGYCAFRFCSGLTSVTIGNSVTTIGWSAFRGCSGLTGALTIGNSVTVIGQMAFRDCIGLISVTIPSSVSAIIDSAFAGCSGLTSINVDANNLNYSSNDGILYSKVQDVLILCPMTKTGSITIPSSVTTIGRGAFGGCSGLISVTIPNSVTTIDQCAFRHCRGLTSITIPNSVTTIDNWAFQVCSGLTSITCKANVPPSLGLSAFANVPNGIPVYVPCYSLNAYQTANWRTYFNNFQLLPTDTNFISAAICNGATYTANGFNASTEGVYSRTEQNANGCDSVITLNLSVFAVVDTAFINATITEGEAYTDNGFNESATGIYQLILQNVNGCDSVIVLNLSVNANGLNDIEATDFNIYPNPASNRLFIEGEGFERVIVYDVLGKEVLASNKKEIDISSLASGVYNVRILQSGNTIGTKKVVKQ